MSCFCNKYLFRVFVYFCNMNLLDIDFSSTEKLNLYEKATCGHSFNSHAG